MTFARQKRLLLGALAFLAPLPLPLNGVIGWPSMLLFLAGVGFFLRRASRDEHGWLPTWGMNLLGLAYLPFFLFDLLYLGRGQLVGPVVRLGLFALLVKLFSLERERDKWQVGLGVFFLFLAAMGTSVHPSIVLYLAAFVVLGLALLLRFAFLHVLAGFGRVDHPVPELPMRGFLTFATVGSLLIAVPLFALLPRVRSPYLIGRGTGLGTTIEAAGFSDEVTLDSIGRIRNSREVALRLTFEDGAPPNGEVRLKASTYDLYKGRAWRRSPSGPLPRRGARGGRVELGSGRPERWVELALEPGRSRSLPLPVEALSVDRGTMGPLLLDQGGAMELSSAPSDVVRYRAGLGRRPLLVGAVPRIELPGEPTLDGGGVTPRIAGLAARAMGDGSPGDRARQLEGYLIQNYEYTVDFVGRSADDPLEDFLFRYKSGHCEYFASAMVLMLRSQGIPARLVTGFLGAEYSVFEEKYLVRDNNAHAWVEAYLPGEGWRIFDPTPPAGRPASERRGGFVLAQQAWEYLVFRWDRYVLTFGIYDQLQIFRGLYGAWRALLKLVPGGGSDSPGGTGEPAARAPADSPSEPPGPGLPIALLLLSAVGAVVAALLIARYRRPLTAATAYRCLRDRLIGQGARIPESLAPLGLLAAVGRHPEAVEPAARIVELYLRESFGGQEVDETERRELKEALSQASRGLRKAVTAEA